MAHRALETYVKNLLPTDSHSSTSIVHDQPRKSDTMTKTFLFVFGTLFVTTCNAFSPQLPKSQLGINLEKVGKEMKGAAFASFAALAIASNVLSNTPQPAQASFDFSGSSTMVSEKVLREGMYQDYEVDLVQQYDDARSTYKPAKETKSKKGKYTAILAVLVVGSFIIPMAQYFWYVKEDDSTDKFFEAKGIKVAAKAPEPPKKKGWFEKKAIEKPAVKAPEPPKKKGWF